MTAPTWPIDKFAFGIIREPMAVQGRRFTVEPNARFQEAVDLVFPMGLGQQLRWIHPPTIDRDPLNADGYAYSFNHPSTHDLILDQALALHDDLPDFLILLLGFLLGIKLHPAGLGGLRKMPLHRGMLVEFTATDADLVEALEAGIDFYVGASAEQRSLMYAALHWYLESLCYDHEFEMFAWQYTVLDNMHRLAGTLPGYAAPRLHADRPVSLGKFHGVPLPSVFTGQGSTSADRLATLRNEIVHEARFLGNPIGYTTSDESKQLLRHLIVFNSQLILKALGVRCAFAGENYAGAKMPLQVGP